METVGQRIRRLRTEREINQAFLAGLIGVNQSTISNIERDNVELSAAYLYAIARALNVSPDTVWLGTEEQDMESMEILRILRTLDAAERQTLLKLARALAPDTANAKAA